ncbi:hypothetical protein BY458DRAFT_547358 [Sporodiniella umbellata]|nr:hypothetical protein BY458DRAFT_547358 [Sporodiniella umbellata]
MFTALELQQFLATVQHGMETELLFDDLIGYLQNPLVSLHDPWAPYFATTPALFGMWTQLMSCARQSSHAAEILRKVAEHYPLIYRVSCFLDSELEIELFVRSLCLDSTTPVQHKEIRETLFRFLNQLSPDVREMVMHILTEDSHGYFGKEDSFQNEFLDLDQLKHCIADPHLFEQVMATIQINTYLNLPWTQTIQDIYALVKHREIWHQLAPILEQAQTSTDLETVEYTSYEDYVQKNFLDDGGQEYLDAEIDRSQVEYMFQNLKM